MRQSPASGLHALLSFPVCVSVQVSTGFIGHYGAREQSGLGCCWGLRYCSALWRADGSDFDSLCSVYEHIWCNYTISLYHPPAVVEICYSSVFHNKHTNFALLYESVTCSWGCAHTHIHTYTLLIIACLFHPACPFVSLFFFSFSQPLFGFSICSVRHNSTTYGRTVRVSPCLWPRLDLAVRMECFSILCVSWLPLLIQLIRRRTAANTSSVSSRFILDRKWNELKWKDPALLRPFITRRKHRGSHFTCSRWLV